MESEIYPLAIYLEDKDVIFNKEFFYDTPNSLLEFSPEDAHLVDSLRVIEVDCYREGHHLELVMDDEESGRTVAYLEPDSTSKEPA